MQFDYAIYYNDRYVPEIKKNILSYIVLADTREL